MKKMVCEICGSQSIRKENGVFVCQECGTEYSLEEAKGLLLEVELEPNTFEGEKVSHFKDSAEKVTKNDDNKYLLLKRLITWYKVVEGFEDSKRWTKHDPDYYLVEHSPQMALDEVKNIEKITSFPIIDDELIKRVIDYKRTDEDIRNNFVIEQILGKSNVFYSFTNDGLVSVYRKNMLNYGLEKIYCNGQGPFNQYYLCVPGNYATGWPFEKLYDSPSIMYALAVQNKRLIAVKDIVNHGFFGDKVSHESANALVDPDKLFARIREIKSQITSAYSKLVTFYKENFDKIKENYIESIELIIELEKEFMLPLKYRSVSALIRLISYIEEGRADSWKEAVNLYETEQYRENVVGQLSNINKTISSIDQNLKDGLFVMSSQLTSIDNKLGSVNNNLSACREAVTNIMYDTRFSLIMKII